jgi:hypothetical protein
MTKYKKCQPNMTQLLELTSSSYLGSGERRIEVQGQPGLENLPDPISKNKPGVMVHTCNSSYSGGRGRRIKSEANLSKSMRPYFKACDPAGHWWLKPVILAT